MKKPHNIDSGCDEGKQSDSSKTSTETVEELAGTYYYDDSTGYEIFTEDDEEESSP